jgi:hypothetical protein
MRLPCGFCVTRDCYLCPGTIPNGAKVWTCPCSESGHPVAREPGSTLPRAASVQPVDLSEYDTPHESTALPVGNITMGNHSRVSDIPADVKPSANTARSR